MKSKSPQAALHNKSAASATQRRRDLLAFLRSDRPAWHDHDHPELAAGTAWVRNLRNESEHRLRP